MGSHISKSIDISSFIQLHSYLSFSATWTLLTSVRSSRALRRFPALLVPPGHKQGSLEWCHGSRRKTWDRHSAPTLGFRLWHPLIWQTARKQGAHKYTLPVKMCTRHRNVCMFVCLYSHVFRIPVHQNSRPSIQFHTSRHHLWHKTHHECQRQQNGL